MTTFPNRHCLEIGRNFLVGVAPHPEIFVPDIGYHHISAQGPSPMKNSGPNSSFQTGIIFPERNYFSGPLMNYEPPAGPDIDMAGHMGLIATLKRSVSLRWTGYK